MDNKELELRIEELEKKIDKMEKYHRYNFIFKVVCTLIAIFLIGIMFYYISNYYADIFSSFLYVCK